jgi:hypothetical protein
MSVRGLTVKKCPRLRAAVVLLALGAAAQSQARVVSLDIQRTAPAFAGQSFGKVGTYQLL